MQFKVPQFLDIEDKIFGPFTFRQFAYLVGGGGLCFIIYKAMSFYFAIFLILPIAGLSAALTFYKVNNKPFISVLESAFKYAFSDKLYVWKRRKVEKKKLEEDIINKEKAEEIRASKVTSSRIKDLAWSLDILDLAKNNKE